MNQMYRHDMLCTPCPEWQIKKNRPTGRTMRHRVLTAGEEDVGKPFSKVIKDMYPDSSKKRIGGSRE